MGLSPLLDVSIIELKTKDSFPELTHNIHPEQGVNIFLFETEKSVDIRKSTEVEPASISFALLVRSRESSKLAIPCLTLLVAALILLSSQWISERWACTISISVAEFANSMAEQLVTCNMELVTWD